MEPQTTAQPKQYDFWYMPPDNSRTFFGAKVGIVTLMPSLLIVTDMATGTEVYKYNVDQGMKFQRHGGFVKITRLNGKKVSRRNKRTEFYFYDVARKGSGLKMLFLGRKESKSFALDLKQIAGKQPIQNVQTV